MEIMRLEFRFIESNSEKTDFILNIVNNLNKDIINMELRILQKSLDEFYDIM